jgi:folate-binding protein YgfZ
VEGGDAESFVQSQFTNDVSALDHSHSQLHGYCNPKGRLLCIMRLVRHNDGFLLQLPTALCQAIVERLRKYVLRAKVSLNRAEHWAGIGVAGHPAAAALIQHVGPLPDTDNGYLRRGALCVYGLPGPVPRFQVIGPMSELQPLWDALSEPLEPQQAWAWSRLDIDAGIPQILPPTSEAFVPQMVNLDLVGGVSFQKGCYPGQEIVARMHYLGKLKQRMIRAQVTTTAAPGPGDKVYAREHGEQSAGTLVDAQPSGPERFNVLAVVQLTAYRTGKLSLNDPNGPVLEPRPLPYDVPTD